MIKDPSSNMGDSPLSLTLFSDVSESVGEVVTINMRPRDRVGILVPPGSDLRVCGGRGRGQKWYWRREREGWPDLVKAASAGAKIVRVGAFRVRVWETSSRVRAMESKPESERISEASMIVTVEREEERERRERRVRESRSQATAIDGASNKTFEESFILAGKVYGMR